MPRAVSGGAAGNPLLTLVCAVSDAVSAAVGGEIRLQIDGAIGAVAIEWMQNGQAALLQLSADRRRAANVPPGYYVVTVTDATDTEASCVVVVQLVDILAITGYEVRHASGDTARDGRIRAHLRGGTASRFLWSNGVTTTTPELHDVSPGKYVVAPLCEDHTFLHECAPAVVLPSRCPC